MTDEIKIEKGISLKRAEWGKTKYPFGEMEVGDSFFIPCGPDNDAKAGLANRLSTAARYGTRNERGWKFSVRRVEDGVRVWRTA